MPGISNDYIQVSGFPGSIAVDGKGIRSTSKKGKQHSDLQIITAYLTESGVVLGQKEIAHEDKTNEIPVFQEMILVLAAHKRYVSKLPKKQSVRGNVFQALLNDDVLAAVIKNL